MFEFRTEPDFKPDQKLFEAAMVGNTDAAESLAELTMDEFKMLLQSTGATAQGLSVEISESGLLPQELKDAVLKRFQDLAATLESGTETEKS